MNRFEQLIEEIRERAREDDMVIAVEELLDKKSGAAHEKDKNPPHLRLPYSSDPKPIGETWN